MKYIVLTITLTFSFLFAHESLAQNPSCVSTPDNLTLEGSTFSPSIQTSVNKNCGFQINIKTKDELDAYNKVVAIKEAAIKQWNTENPTHYDDPTWAQNGFEAWQTKQLNFQEVLNKKYPDPTLTNYNLETRNGKICLDAGQTTDNQCSPNKTIKLKNAGHTVGVLQVANGKGYIFSVDSGGEKTLNKPYLRISPAGTQGATIESVNQGATSGQMKISGDQCSSSMELPNGTLELSGNEYDSRPSGQCHNFFVVRSFHAIGAGSTVTPTGSISK